MREANTGIRMDCTYVTIRIDMLLYAALAVSWMQMWLKHKMDVLGAWVA
jgi:hypothetical protein